MSLDLRTSLGMARSLAIYYGLPWRRRALKHFYGSLIEPGTLVFDIGAHVGSRTRTLLSLGARVLAVEPQPVLADFLERTLAHRLVGLECKAVGRAQGRIDLHISSRHPTVTTISGDWMRGVCHTEGFRHVVWDRTVCVEMTTLDALIARHGLPAFCKIDVEGAEADILHGLSQPIDLVAFEYIAAMPGVAIAAIERLAAIGDYRFNRVAGETHRFVASDWISKDAMLAQLQSQSLAGSGDVYARIVPP